MNVLITVWGRRKSARTRPSSLINLFILGNDEALARDYILLSAYLSDAIFSHSQIVLLPFNQLSSLSKTGCLLNSLFLTQCGEFLQLHKTSENEGECRGFCEGRCCSPIHFSMRDPPPRIARQDNILWRRQSLLVVKSGSFSSVEIRGKARTLNQELGAVQYQTGRVFLSTPHPLHGSE